MGGKLLRANIKAEGPLGGLTALDSSVRWSARCGHKRRQRGSSGENISYSHRSKRDRSLWRRGSQGTGYTKWEKQRRPLTKTFVGDHGGINKRAWGKSLVTLNISGSQLGE